MLTAHRHSGFHSRKRAAFTLTELLVVLGIIGVLFAITFPAIGRVRAAAKGVECSSRVGQLSKAFLMFAHEHEGRLPGNHGDQDDPDSYKHCWLFQWRDSNSWKKAPQDGTLWKYTHSETLYRCPSLEGTNPLSGAESNGRFDYSSLGQLAGLPITMVKLYAQIRHPNGTIEEIFTPIVLEEDPVGINSVWADALFCAGDKLSNTHLGGAYIGAVDGSVHWVKQDPAVTAWNVFIKAPSGTWTSVGSGEPRGWGTFANN